MRRRNYLTTLGVMTVGGIAGCADLSGDGGTTAPDQDGSGGTTTTEQHDEGGSSGNVPDGVYVPDHATAMTMEGMGRDGDFQFAVMISAPEVFYFVEGTDVVPSEELDELNVHAMASVWDPETGTNLPETGLSVEIRTPDDEVITQEVIYPMLSQRMGFHYGSNYAIPEDGEYVVRVSVGGMSIGRTRGFEGRFGNPASVEIPITFTESKRQKFTESDPENAGERGALSPMSMGARPTGQLPNPADLPGTVLGEATSDDAAIVGGVLTGTELGGDQPYLYVSPRTPYNQFPLVSMGMEVTVQGDTGETRTLSRRLDPELKYHYGTSISETAAEALTAGEADLTVTPTVPPQVTRHEGYQTAFIEMSEATLGQ